MIIFPAYGVFEEYHMAPLGVSMFFLSCLLSQLTYTFGASQFAGANGSMMIEVVVRRLRLHILSLLTAVSTSAVLPPDRYGHCCRSSRSHGDFGDHARVVCVELSADWHSVLPPRILQTRDGHWLLPEAHSCRVCRYLRLVSLNSRLTLSRCIGGVGAFLIETGYVLASRFRPTRFMYSSHSHVDWKFVSPLLRLQHQRRSRTCSIHGTT